MTSGFYLYNTKTIKSESHTIVIKEKGAGSARDSLAFAKKHWNALGEVKYVLLSNADGNQYTSLDPNFYN